MSDLLQLGPLVLATDRALVAMAVVAFLATTRWWHGVPRTEGQRAATLAVVVGAIAARAAWVGRHASSYLTEPWSALYFWQGGFEPVVGIAAAAVVLLLRFGATRRAVVPLAALGFLATGAWSSVAWLEQRAVRAWPQELAVRSMDGDPVALDAFRGRPFVVNLWATWCPPCRREMPLLVAVAAERGAVPILLVNQREDPGVVAAYLAEAGLAEAPVLLDADGAVGAALGARALPTTVFVGADGIVRRRHYGEISRAALESGLREIGAAGAPGSRAAGAQPRGSRYFASR